MSRLILWSSRLIFDFWYLVLLFCGHLGDLLRSFVCLFDLILYVPSTIFQLNGDGSTKVEPVLS